MKNYLLVHGAWGGAWEFDKLKPLLELDGSRVVAINLPGHGNDQTPLAKVTMDAYVQKVVDSTKQFAGEVILVGHSLGGAIISQVAEKIPEKLERIIYVAAMLPKSGDTPLGLMQSDEQGELLPRITFSEDGSYATFTEKDVREVLLHDVEDKSYLDSSIEKLLTKQSTLPFMAEANLTQQQFGNVPKYYIRANLDKVLSPALQDKMLANWPVETVYQLESGHFPMNSMYERLFEKINLASL